MTAESLIRPSSVISVIQKRITADRFKLLVKILHVEVYTVSITQLNAIRSVVGCLLETIFILHAMSYSGSDGTDTERFCEFLPLLYGNYCTWQKERDAFRAVSSSRNNPSFFLGVPRLEKNERANGGMLKKSYGHWKDMTTDAFRCIELTTATALQSFNVYIRQCRTMNRVQLLLMKERFTRRHRCSWIPSTGSNRDLSRLFFVCCHTSKIMRKLVFFDWNLK